MLHRYDPGPNNSPCSGSPQILNSQRNLRPKSTEKIKMPSKSTPNGFYMFMLEERDRIKETTNAALSMQEMAVVCAETWKKLSAAEKTRYDELARDEKAKQSRKAERAKFRMDNHRQIIADRKDPAAEDKKRRTLEAQALLKSWEGQDVLDIKFHVISFQLMYVEEPVDNYLPMEIGMVCFTLRDGVINYLHHFIDPGDAPQGSRHLAYKHSENTHKIPLNFEKASDNFLDVWMQIERFVVDDPRRDPFPPIFCLTDDRKHVEECLDYIHFRARSGEPAQFTKVYTLEDLVISLIVKSGKSELKPPERQIKDSLLRNQWDYVSSIRCGYHDELDCIYCSLAIVKRFSFAVFDLLSNLLDFKLTKNHLPDEASTGRYTVTYPTECPKNNDLTENKRLSHSTRDSARSQVSMSRSHSSCETLTPQSSSPNYISKGAFRGQRVNKVEIELSDSDTDSDAEALYTSQVNSTSNFYDLKALRKPKTLSLALFPRLPNCMPSLARGLTMSAQTSEVVRPGRVEGSGDGAQTSSMRMAFSAWGRQSLPRHSDQLRPPPGFAPHVSGPLLVSEDFPVLGEGSAPALLRLAVPDAQGHNLGARRTRGMPPQVWPSQRPV